MQDLAVILDGNEEIRKRPKSEQKIISDAIQYVEQNGIVFLDEIDENFGIKIKRYVIVAERISLIRQVQIISICISQDFVVSGYEGEATS